MKRLRWLSLLMGITILIIIGFQAYWLKDNYDREKKTMQIKSRVAFEETIEQLQASKLKLPGMFKRTSDPERDEVFDEEKITKPRSKIAITLPREIAKTTRLTYRFNDSSRKDSSVQPVFIVMKDSTGIIRRMPVHRSMDSAGNKRMIFNSIEEISSISDERRQIVSTINILRSRLRDSSKKDSGRHFSFFITIPADSNREVRNPAMKVRRYTEPGKQYFRKFSDSNNQALRVLYTVDSLQDSLQLPEVIKNYSASLSHQNLTIPFSITRPGNTEFKPERDLSDITVGFAHPVKYRLSLGNTAPYLIRRLTWPILFSIFLAGVTIFSFVLLYRNLLRQQKLGEIKNDFISNITHELKTPIATVGVAIEALKNFNAIHDPQKTKEYLDISANELQRLSLLVDKVLKLSMFEKKEVELNKENFDMKELTREVLDTMKLQFEKNHAIVNFNVEGNDFTVNADKLHITSVIYNLLDNALKYRMGDPLIKVLLLQHHNDIELKIEDNGIGIAHEYQGKIFDKFFRVPTGNKHIVKGYGLGLSYVSHIIAQHKGTIKVDSELNQGSTFTIKIPIHAEG